MQTDTLEIPQEPESLKGIRLYARHASLCWGVRVGTVEPVAMWEWLRGLSNLDLDLLDRARAAQ